MTLIMPQGIPMVLRKLFFFVHKFLILILQQRIKQIPNIFGANESHDEHGVEYCGTEIRTKFKLGENEKCCVCLSRYREGEEINILPCMHKFHKECIEKWFGVCKKNCPICRFSMEKDKSNTRELLIENMITYLSSFQVNGFEL